MVLVNPSSALLGRSHVILNGIGRDYHVSDFPGPMSIKSVLRGKASWETDEGRFEIGSGSCVVLNDRQPYSITVESKELVETLCVFFATGYVEDIQRATASSDLTLLDAPMGTGSFTFQQRLRIRDCVLTPLLRELYCRREEDVVLRLGEALVGLHEETMVHAAKLPAAKASTRAELMRRVNRGRNVIEGSLTQPISLTEVASSAALSPYHFHRSFTRIFHETPNAYLTRRRVEYAAELLKNSSLPVTEICFACGYQSLGSFSSLFRSSMGVSPRQYRAGKN